jgi:aspartyl-tRNA(Asn)/glutamyl-tRNA(Gln) amidotransferase subunit C
MSRLLTLDEVRHVARLGRLRLSEQELELYRDQLSTVLDHIGMLAELDVEGVEPMAHPAEITNRLDEDDVALSLPRQTLLALAPAVKGAYLAVPKVLGGDEP